MVLIISLYYTTILNTYIFFNSQQHQGRCYQFFFSYPSDYVTFFKIIYQITQCFLDYVAFCKIFIRLRKNELNIYTIQSTVMLKFSTAIYSKTTSGYQSANLNNTKLNVHKNVLQELCEKFNGAEEFIKDKIEEICSSNDR